ncbi:MFS transporter [Nakamurella aerolata]|uniref:MFS transporter n=1 Tax=Nakamurella aerolata TaxID=1656892 RepID=A0A849A0W5_9ACTN|nr:MFS transporter [Nakamurella aerolata]NNG34674.1 MFS transporter [Nakamurella aerolata]
MTADLAARPHRVRGPLKAAGHGTGFWLLAGSFAVVMAFTTLPTPMYRLYQERDHFPTFMITLIFAAYGFGVMAGLYLAGHLSDYLGRRRVIVASVLLQLVATAIFLFSKDTAALLVARFICGVGIGALTSTATAQLTELRSTAAPGEPPRFAATVATVVNMGGLSLGPLVGGVLTQWLPSPLTLPFAVFGVLLLAVVLVVLVVPETVERSKRRYRPQRVAVAPHHRGEFVAAALAAAAAFSVMGFFTALTATLLGGVMHIDSRFAIGVTVFALMASCAASQVLFARMAPRPKIRWGMALMTAGLVLVALGGLTASFAVFVVSAVVAGAGVGLVFTSAIAAAGRMADPGRRGETIAGMFLAAYAGITVPVIAAGVALSWVPPVTVLVVFAGVVEVCVLAGTAQMLRHTTN